MAFKHNLQDLINKGETKIESTREPTTLVLDEVNHMKENDVHQGIGPKSPNIKITHKIKEKPLNELNNRHM